MQQDDSHARSQFNYLLMRQGQHVKRKEQQAVGIFARFREKEDKKKNKNKNKGFRNINSMFVSSIPWAAYT